MPFYLSGVGANGPGAWQLFQRFWVHSPILGKELALVIPLMGSDSMPV